MRALRGVVFVWALLAGVVVPTWAKPPADLPLYVPADVIPSGFLTWQDIRGQLDALKKQFPHLIHEDSIGKTAEGRDIVVIRVSDDAEISSDPELLILSGTHPREQQPHMMTMLLLHELAHAYGKDPYLTKLVQERQTWVLPMLNVDGKLYDMRDWGGGAAPAGMWRKNRGADFQVDLNRNFAIAWGGAGEKSDSNTYQGPEPLSAPESKALASFFEARPLRAFFDIHSYMRTYLPPGTASPAEAARFNAMVSQFQATQKSPYPGRSVHSTGLLDEKANTGVIQQFAYYTKGIYGFCFEVYPKNFYPAPAEVYTEYQDNVRGVFFSLIEQTGDLRVMTPGQAVLQSAEVVGRISPGQTFVWKPQIQGEAEWASLISWSKDVTVHRQKPMRLAPFTEGFELAVEADAKPGTTVPITLYVWDAQHRRTVIEHTLTVE